ncbi:MAG: hypothetical protein JWO05_1558 [Gemmatimonadetes bacterium]|nr:hypothetical protein [Gemmatimonadota bacterium]
MMERNESACNKCFLLSHVPMAAAAKVQQIAIGQPKRKKKNML